MVQGDRSFRTSLPPPGQYPLKLPSPCRSHTKYRQWVFEALLRNMPPRDVADLLQAKQFLAQFACPPA